DDEERRAAARMQRRLLAHVLERQRQARLVGVDRLVLGAVILEDAADVLELADRDEVARQHEQLEAAGEGMETPVLDLEIEAQPVLRRGGRALRERHEDQQRDERGERERAVPRAGLSPLFIGELLLGAEAEGAIAERERL